MCPKPLVIALVILFLLIACCGIYELFDRDAPKKDYDEILPKDPVIPPPKEPGKAPKEPQPKETVPSTVPEVKIKPAPLELTQLKGTEKPKGARGETYLMPFDGSQRSCDPGYMCEIGSAQVQGNELRLFYYNDPDGELNLGIESRLPVRRIWWLRGETWESAGVLAEGDEESNTELNLFFRAPPELFDWGELYLELE